jgi:transposase-like protein
MGKKPHVIAIKRIYSEEFKKARVLEYEKGLYTVKELSSLFHLPFSLVYRWIRKYSLYNQKRVRIVEMDQSGSQKVKELQARIKELERIVGVKQLNIEFLEKVIDLAQEEFHIDIKKNFSTQPSDGLHPKKNKEAGK